MPNEEVEVTLAAPAEGTTAEASATTETEESQAAAAAAAEAARPGGVQKRIDELTRKAREAERAAEVWRQEALKAKPATAAETVQPVVEKPKEKPKADDFESQELFVDALTDWKLEQREAAKETERKQQALRTEQQTTQEQFQQKTVAYKAAVPDFEDVMAAASDVPVSPAVIHEILSHENGPALQYYLAKNPAEAERLNKLGPLALAREVGRLEPRFTTAPAAAAEAATQDNVTRAAAPITPLAGTSKTAGKDPGDMSPEEYRTWRAKTYPNLR